MFNLKPTAYSSGNQVSKGLDVLKKLNQAELYTVIKANNPTLSEEQISSAMKMMSSLDENSYKTASANPINSVTTVRWSDNFSKAFILNATLTVKNETITLIITKTDENLLPPNFD